jgi:hypothetical protein
MIWQAALSARQQVIELRVYHHEVNPMNYPAALHVSQESRQVARRVLEGFRFDENLPDLGIGEWNATASRAYFDATRDIIYLRKRWSKRIFWDYDKEHLRMTRKDYCGNLAASMDRQQLSSIQHPTSCYRFSRTDSGLESSGVLCGRTFLVHWIEELDFGIWTRTGTMC